MKLKKIDVNMTNDLLSNGAILYTVAWLREGEQTGSVKFCYGINQFKDDGNTATGASHDDGATMSGATGFALPLPPIPDVFDAGPSRVLLLLVVLLAAAAASPVSASLKQQQGPCRSKRRVL